jgi:hypothetical protein
VPGRTRDKMRRSERSYRRFKTRASGRRISA